MAKDLLGARFSLLQPSSLGSILVKSSVMTSGPQDPPSLESWNKSSHSYFVMMLVSGVSCKLSGGVQRDVMVETNAQKAFIKKIEKKLGYVLKKEKRGGVSDANVFAEKGVATLDGFGPFGDGDHTVHERANKKSFEQRINESYQIFELYQV